MLFSISCKRFLYTCFAPTKGDKLDNEKMGKPILAPARAAIPSVSATNRKFAGLGTKMGRDGESANRLEPSIHGAGQNDRGSGNKNA